MNHWDYSNILGLPPGAPLKEIDKAYNILQKKHADDKIMLEGIQRAYVFLRDMDTLKLLEESKVSRDEGQPLLIMDEEECYKILDLPADASKEEIKQAHKKLSEKYAGEEAKLMKIDQAYTQLVHPVMLHTLKQIQGHEKQKREAWKSARHEIVFGLLVLILIPISIGLWNVHPLLGLLVIIFFCWLIKNKWASGYYLGE